LYPVFILKFSNCQILNGAKVFPSTGAAEGGVGCILSTEAAEGGVGCIPSTGAAEGGVGVFQFLILNF